MKSAEGNRRIADTRRVFKDVSKRATSDPDMSGHWARYMTIVVAGQVEQIFRQVLVNYARANAQSDVANFIVDELRFFQNPQLARILEHLGKFEESWKESFRKSLTKRHLDALETIIGNRHEIAHGSSTTPPFKDVEPNFEALVNVLEILEAQAIARSRSGNSPEFAT